MNPDLYPLHFKPVYKDYLWGGDRIIRAYGRDEPPGVYAESWELADRSEGMSEVTEGELSGKTLRELVQTYSLDLMGTAVKQDTFPLLIKIIDPRKQLSVQVHPDDDAAARWGGDAKMEMWYFLDAEPGTNMIAGLAPEVDRETFEEALETGSFENVLRKVPVKKGQAVLIPGGTVHAMNPGCLVLEIQQNSNTTYRIHDWGRVDVDGRPRELHRKQTLRVIRWEDEPPVPIESRPVESAGGNERWEVVQSAHFRMERLLIREEWPCENDGLTFHYLFPARGELKLVTGSGDVDLIPGRSILIPACITEYRLRPLETEAEVLRVGIC